LRGNVLAIIHLILRADLLGLCAAIFNATIATTIEATKSGAIITIQIQDTRGPTVRGTFVPALFRGLEMYDWASLLDRGIRDGCTYLRADRIADRLIDGVTDGFFSGPLNNFINDLAIVTALLLCDGRTDRLLLNRATHLGGHVFEPAIASRLKRD
jgi:hypothetical protein